MGSLADRAPSHVALAAPPILLGVAVLLRLGRGLDALALGEAVAASLGQPPGRTLARAAIGVALIVGAATSVAGGIGFVGLAVPHLLRPWPGQRPSALLAAAALAGAALSLAADLVLRVLPLVLPLGQEPPLGVLTAMHRRAVPGGAGGAADGAVIAWSAPVALAGLMVLHGDASRAGAGGTGRAGRAERCRASRPCCGRWPGW